MYTCQRLVGLVAALDSMASFVVASHNDLPIQVAGSWEGQWGTQFTVSSQMWLSAYPGSPTNSILISHYDNVEGFLVGQAGATNTYNPSKWNRIDWLFDESGTLWYCSTHFDADSEAMAMEEHPAHDHSLYDTTGCGGYPFTALGPAPEHPLAIAGAWNDGWGGEITVGQDVMVSWNSWGGSAGVPGPSMQHITHYDNEKGFLVGQNYGDGSYNPGLWSRVDWVKDTSDSYWICTTHYDAANETMAMLDHPDHDHSLYETSGCNTYPFSQISKASTDAISIAGSWEDSYATKITISQYFYVETYFSGTPSLVYISQFSEDDDYLVGLNDGPGSYYPGMYSRIDWTTDADGGLHLCTSHYEAPDEATALIPAATTDHTLYDTTGCNGFPFSSLAPPPPAPLAIAGEWEDGWGTKIVASKYAFASTYGYEVSVIMVTHYDNAAGFLVGQNGGDGSYNPGNWSRVDWHKDVDDSFWYCTTHYNAASETDAMAEHPQHDHSLYDTTGCGGYPFSQMSRPYYPCAEFCSSRSRRSRNLLFGSVPEPGCVCL